MASELKVNGDGPFVWAYDDRRWTVWLDDKGDLKYVCDTNREGQAKEIVAAMNEYVAVFERNLAKINEPKPVESLATPPRAKQDEAPALPKVS